MKHQCWRIACAAGVLALLCWVGAGRADDEKSKGKGKPKEEPKKTIIEVDLSKLPPDLVKQLLKYADGKKGAKTEEKKSPKEEFGAVVQKLKAKGLRGRALAAAIHKEQAKRGMKGAEKKKEPKKDSPGKKKKKDKDDD